MNPWYKSGPGMKIPGPDKYAKSREINLTHISSLIPTITVGSGISPDRAHFPMSEKQLLAGFTAGREFITLPRRTIQLWLP